MRASRLIPAVLVLLVGAAAAAGPPAAPAFSITSPDGNSSLRLQLVAQLRADLLFKDPNDGEARELEESVFFRRIRPVLAGTLVRALSYQLQLNVAPGAAELIDLYADYAFIPEVRLLVGQAKIPFTRYRLSSFKDLPVVDWSFPTRWLGAERQVGIMVHNGFSRPPPLEYEVGLYTGVNARASNGIGMAALTGTQLSSPSSLVDGGPVGDIHPELAAHVAYNAGGIDVRRFTDFEGGPPRYAVGVSAAWDLAPQPREDFRLRVAPEVMLKLYGFSLTGVFYVALFDERAPAEPAHSYRCGLLGGVVLASYLFLERYEVAVRYTRMQLSDELREFAAGIAERALFEASAAELLAVRKQYAGVGELVSVQQADLAFDVYVLGPSLKWQVEGSLVSLDRTGEDRLDLALRTQILLAL